MVRDIVSLSDEYLLILDALRRDEGISETKLQKILHTRNKGEHPKDIPRGKNSLSPPTVTRRRKELSAWGYIERKKAEKQGIRKIVFTDIGNKLYNDFLSPLRDSTQQFDEISKNVMRKLRNHETLADKDKDEFLVVTMLFFANMMKCGGSSLLLFEKSATAILLAEIVRASGLFKKVIFFLKGREEYREFLEDRVNSASSSSPMLKLLQENGFDLLAMLGLKGTVVA